MCVMLPRARLRVEALLEQLVHEILEQAATIDAGLGGAWGARAHSRVRSLD
jgi:hypothetical protein